MTGLAETVEGGRTRVQLAAVEQLLLMASDRLQLARDARGALGALELADQRLARLRDPRLHRVREALAQERAVVAALVAPDLEGAALALARLLEQAPGFPLRVQIPDRFESPPAAESAAPEGAWRRAVAAVRVALAQVFALRRLDGAPPRLLSADEAALVGQILQLKLEGARLALLAADGRSYRELIRSARAWLQAQYDLRDARAQAAAVELDRLATLDLAPAPPDLGRTLALLRSQLRGAVMRPLALAVACAVLGAAAAYVLRAEAGYVLVSYGAWVLETSLLGFVATTLVGLMLVAAALRLLQALLGLPRILRERTTLRRERRAQESFESGLHKLLHGHFTEAEIELVRRAADHRTPELNYVLAARAAQRVGAHERRDRYLESAAARDAAAAQLTRAELMLQRGEAAAAVTVLEPLAAARPAAPYALEMLAEAYARTGAWAALRRLLAGPETQRALPLERHRALTAQSLRAGIAAAVADARLDALKAVWEAAPPPYREDGDVRLAYAAGLARLGADAEAGALIVSVMEQRYDAPLARLYGELNGLDPMTQLATVEQWLQRHGEQADVLLSAGLVCMRNQLWGKARSYLDAALKLKPAAPVYLALARLCEQTRKPEEAQIFYRRGLDLAAG